MGNRGHIINLTILEELRDIIRRHPHYNIEKLVIEDYYLFIRLRFENEICKDITIGVNPDG